MGRAIGCLVVGLVLLASPAWAQTPTRIKNPSAVAFTPSVDHATLSHYEADVLNAQGGTIQTINLGKPTPGATGECQVALNLQPVAFGVYRLQLRSVAGGVTGPPSSPTEEWERAPGPPTKVVVR